MAAAVVLGALLLAGGASLAEYRHTQIQTKRKAEAITHGNVDRGERLFVAYGCGSCHTATGVLQATAQVGPPMTGIAGRAIIAGRLQNTPSNLEKWIIDPQSVSPGTAMPRLGVSSRDARDLAAFLYTQS